MGGSDTTPAGWYPDPAGSGQQRYYDGQQWTAQYAPAAGPPVVVVAPRKSNSGKVVLIVFLALFLLCGGGCVSMIASMGSDNASSDRSTTTSSRSAAAAPPPPTSTAPPGPSPHDLDPAAYTPLESRDFALLVKDPNAAIGRKVIVYGYVTQFDAATGRTAFRANVGPTPGGRYDYEQNAVFVAEDPAILSNVVEDDLVTMHVESEGSTSYDTQIGGSTTVPKFTVYIIAVTGSGG